MRPAAYKMSIVKRGPLNNLGLAWQAVRRFDEAVTAHKDANAAFKRVSAQLKEESFQWAHARLGEGAALHNLGLALQHLRRFDEAIAAFQQDLVICREVGDRH